MPDKRTRNRKKLQALLRDLFQFDHADLDFGIYRIMNEKRDEVERFIEHDLLDVVEEALSQFREADRPKLERQLAEAREQLAPEAFDSDGAVIEQFRALGAAKQYMELRRQIRQTAVAAETEARVFNDLWRFFSRYYDQGDFLTERRYSSRGAKYCVPYDGEEVMLHWANRDQYYVKTSERFTDYRFNAGDHTVWFRLVQADVPQDNVRGDTRYFVLREDQPLTYDDETKALIIPFAYRPISEEEEEHYLDLYNAHQSRSNRRKTLDRSVLCTALETEILAKLDRADLKAALAAVPEGRETSALGRHLNRYTARHTMDYFVHKDLGGFLRRELDVFLKTEVMHLGDLVSEEASDMERHQEMALHVLTRMRVVRQIAHRIIDFLAQIEDFQMRLFEKRKFIVQTDYCVTLDRVSEALYPEILANEAQLEAWRELYAMDGWPEDLFWQGKFDEAFLAQHPYLMIDTALFDRDFKARLLATFDDIDGATDGVLIHGENFQALSLLRAQYDEREECIFIDPPYNTGNDDFVYKDNYQHSSWLSMMRDRLVLGRGLLAEDGAIFISIDDEEQENLRQLCNEVYGRGNFVANIVWQKKYAPQNDARWLSDDHDHVVLYARNKQVWRPNRLPRTEKQNQHYSNPDDDPRGPWMSDNYASNKSAEERPNLYYPIVNPNTGEEIWPPRQGVWRYTREQHRRNVKNDRVWWGVDGTNTTPRYKRFLSEVGGIVPRTIWPYQKAGHNQDAVRELQALFGESPFSSPKPTKLIRRILQVAPGSQVLDYFAGSGTTAHAVMELNREDSGERKYILVEMGDYFDTVLKPRILKVAFSANWKDGVPQDRDGMSHMVKYHRIESYEDALNNIRVRQPEGGQLELLRQFDDYMLHYMLDFETRDSPTLLAQEAFERPFHYTLRIQQGHESPKDTTVDLVETFHYLIGMHVRRLERYQHQGRTYVVSRGDVRTEQGIEHVVTIWRDTEGLDLEREADWVDEEVLTQLVDRVYVNGYENFIRKAEPTEITFRQRMEGS
jgi:adenine-specific DNA-methyltransferase